MFLPLVEELGRRITWSFLHFLHLHLRLSYDIDIRPYSSLMYLGFPFHVVYTKFYLPLRTVFLHRPVYFSICIRLLYRNQMLFIHPL
ncbi:hypothetical protein C8R42DRAFT_660588 [Lentinula raphanica]|nr:hypothetical protein C8R42DRAFT_660588 [Lentinula raphanica]